MSDVDFSNAFWLGLAMVAVTSFLIVFIPGFYLSYIIFRKHKLDSILGLFLSIVIGFFISNFISQPVSNFLLSLEFIHHSLPTIMLFVIFILEIITIVIHFRKNLKRQKKTKR